MLVDFTVILYTTLAIYVLLGLILAAAGFYIVRYVLRRFKPFSSSEKARECHQVREREVHVSVL